MGRKGRFRYVDARGKRITDPAKLERIEALVIPPAWKDVWISPRPRAKLQATGVDAAGRQQYLYHPDFRARQEQAKYDKLIRFAERLPDAARGDGEHMEREPLDRERRRGDRAAADQPRLVPRRLRALRARSRTYGITTLREAHVAVRGSRITFRFRGKHRVQVRTALVDAELADGDARAARASGRPRGLPLRAGGRALQPHAARGSTTTSASTWARSSRRRTSAPGAGRCSPRSRSPSAAPRRDRDRGEARRRGRHARGRRAARKYAGGRARVVRQPGGRRAVSRRANDRGFPAAPFARRRRARYRSRSGGAGAAEPAPLVANSACARSRVISLVISVRLRTSTATNGGEIRWHGRPFSFATTAARKSTKERARRCAITYADARRGAKQADLCDDVRPSTMPAARRRDGAAAGRRPRRPVGRNPRQLRAPSRSRERARSRRTAGLDSTMASGWV